MIPAFPPPAFIWAEPGTDPYRGSFEHAIAVIEDTGVTTPYTLSHLTVAGGARCRSRQIRDGEGFEAMAFGDGRVIRNVVAATSSWPSGASRMALECTDGLGNALVRPEVCGNWSFEFVPPLAGAAWPTDDTFLPAPVLRDEFASWGSWLPSPLTDWGDGGGDNADSSIASNGVGPAAIDNSIPNAAEPSSISIVAAAVIFMVAATRLGKRGQR